MADAQFALGTSAADLPAVLAGSASRGSVAVFDERTGRLRQLFGLEVDGPRLELWRAPTDNDRGDRL